MCEVRRIIIGVSHSVIPCVGAVVTDEQGRLLMIKRGHEPGAGLWSIPGGRIEPGETDAEALAREMLEETGLTVEVGRLVGTVQRPGPGGAVLDIRDYAATVIGGTLAAADDAADARWVRAEDLNALPLTEGLADILTSWGVLGQERQLSSYFSAYNLAVLFARFGGYSGISGRPAARPLATTPGPSCARPPRSKPLVMSAGGRQPGHRAGLTGLADRRELGSRAGRLTDS